MFSQRLKAVHIIVYHCVRSCSVNSTLKSVLFSYDYNMVVVLERNVFIKMSPTHTLRKDKMAAIGTKHLSIIDVRTAPLLPLCQLPNILSHETFICSNFPVHYIALAHFPFYQTQIASALFLNAFKVCVPP